MEYAWKKQDDPKRDGGHDKIINTFNSCFVFSPKNTFEVIPTFYSIEILSIQSNNKT